MIFRAVPVLTVIYHISDGGESFILLHRQYYILSNPLCQLQRSDSSLIKASTTVPEYAAAALPLAVRP